MGALGAGAVIGDVALIGAPHSLQNLALALAFCPQAGQTRTSFAPHSSQNLTLAGFSNPQLAQRMGLIPSRIWKT
ncbi:hypothetical protein CS8_092000 [Cupriavidus sp. 8B]